MFKYEICGIIIHITKDDAYELHNEKYSQFIANNYLNHDTSIKFNICTGMLDAPKEFINLKTTNIYFDKKSQKHIIWDISMQQGKKCHSWMVANENWSNIEVFSLSNRLPLFLESNYILTALSSRICFFNGLLMHGVVVEHNELAVVFTASSGVGKTTHSEFWRENFGDRIINGDKAFLRCFDDKVYAYGSPWSGSSPYITNLSAPLKAIVVLEQANENSIKKLNIQEAIKYCAIHCYYPAWDERLTMKYMDTLGVLLQNVQIYLLKCKPEKEAAVLVRDTIFT